MFFNSALFWEVYKMTNISNIFHSASNFESPFSQKFETFFVNLIIQFKILDAW